MTDVRARLGVGMAAGVMLHLWCGIAAAAGTCKAEDFGATVDAAGAQLRAYNLEASPRLQARIKLLAAKKGWNEQEVEDNAIMYLQDDRITKLDETSNTLFGQDRYAGTAGAGCAGRLRQAR